MRSNGAGFPIHQEIHHLIHSKKCEGIAPSNLFINFLYFGTTRYNATASKLAIAPIKQVL